MEQWKDFQVELVTDAWGHVVGPSPAFCWIMYHQGPTKRSQKHSARVSQTNGHLEGSNPMLTRPEKMLRYPFELLQTCALPFFFFLACMQPKAEVALLPLSPSLSLLFPDVFMYLIVKLVNDHLRTHCILSDRTMLIYFYFMKKPSYFCR